MRGEWDLRQQATPATSDQCNQLPVKHHQSASAVPWGRSIRGPERAGEAGRRPAPCAGHNSQPLSLIHI
eukprot:2469854-Alexandrium_andersonii.AAC.1